MRLSGMADRLEQLPSLDANARLTTPDVVKLAVDHEWERRQTNRLSRLRRAAALTQPHADVADILALPGRRVDQEAIARLAVGTYILKHQDVIIQGPTGSGKTYVACALGNKACQQHKRVVYLPAGEVFDRLVIADRAGRRRAEVDSLARADLLIIDDWFLTAPTREHVQLIHPLIDRRHGAASTMFCTQLAPDQWHDRVEEKILADAIIDRITAGALVTALDSDQSLRRHFAQADR